VPSQRPSRQDDGNAFVPDTSGEHRPLLADDAESFAEEFVASATMGESVGEDARDEVVDDEEGGPFIVLDENGRLPPEPGDDRDAGAADFEPDREGPEPVSHERAIRAGRWAARGA
jgi:hypothetical protein